MDAKRNINFSSIQSIDKGRSKETLGSNNCDLKSLYIEPVVLFDDSQEFFKTKSDNFAKKSGISKDLQKPTAMRNDYGFVGGCINGSHNKREENTYDVTRLYNKNVSNRKTKEETQNDEVRQSSENSKPVRSNSYRKVTFSNAASITNDSNSKKQSFDMNPSTIVKPTNGLKHAEISEATQTRPINLASPIGDQSNIVTKCYKHLAIASEAEDELNRITDQTSAAKMLEDSIHVILDRPLEIICELEGCLDPTVKWFYKASKSESSSEEYELVKIDDSRRKVSLFRDYTKLVIKKPTHLDTGVYKVLLNDCTWTSPGTEVVVWDPPVTPTSSPIIKVITQDNGEVSLDIQWDPLDESRCSPHWYEVECFMDGDYVSKRCVRQNRVVFHGAPRGRLIKWRYRMALPCGVSDPSPVATIIIDYPSKPECFPDQQLLKMTTYEDTYTETGTVLGKGAFGKVILVKDQCGNEFASKYSKNKAKTREVALREFSVMQRLSHDRIVRLYGGYEDAQHIVLVTEYLSGGELFERMVQEEVLTEADCVPYIRQICEGVGFIHHQRVVHLDLKAENVMCVDRQTNRIKIIDFGLAHILENEPSGLKTMYGTRDYAAPEIVNYDDITFNTDMWSVGVITYVLLSGLLPFSGDTWTEESAYISAVEYNYEDEAFDNISDEAKDFINRLLVKVPSRRMSAIVALTHTWLAGEPGNRAGLARTKENLKTYLAVCKQRWQMARNVLIAARRLRVNVENRRSPAGHTNQAVPD